MVCLVGLLGSGAAWAKDDAPAWDEFLDQHVGASGGYAVSLGGLTPDDSDIEDLNFAALVGHWAVAFTGPFGSSWYRSQVEWVPEGYLLWSWDPTGGFAGGFSPLVLRYDFLAPYPFIPYVDGALGVIWTNFDLDNQADGFNFVLQAGLGAYLAFWDTTALNLQVRFHHISNANTNPPNVSINDLLFLVGFTTEIFGD